MKISLWVSPILFLFSLVMALPSEAHNRSQSFSSWSFEDKNLYLLFSVKSIEATRLQSVYEPNLERSIEKHLQETIKVTQGIRDCPLEEVLEPNVKVLSSGQIEASATFNCPLNLYSSALEIEVGSFFEIIPSHTHYARIFVKDALPLEHLFTDSSRRQHFDLQGIHYSNSSARTIFNFIILGIKHILSGPDHIMFLLALLLMLPSFKGLIWLVTGFTLGHSVSLCLATLGFFVPSGLRIEALIGFTIALASAEGVGARHDVISKIAYGSIVLLCLVILIARFTTHEVAMSTVSLFGLMIFSWNYLHLNVNNEDRVRIKAIVCLVFGLVHGFGFASGLGGIGLPNERIWVPMLGFNLGVELGQLLIIFLSWVFYVVLSRHESTLRATIDMSSGIICGIGVYWFVIRSLEPVVL